MIFHSSASGCIAMFHGLSSFTIDIQQVLGTPTKEELKHMNPNYQEFKFPVIRAHPWPTIFKPNTPADCMDIIAKLLSYVPENRYKAIEVILVLFFFVLLFTCYNNHCDLPLW
jgi:hypothetical protein